jgi:hypothetical protein
MRAIASINPSAGLSGLTTTEMRSRRQMDINAFFNRKQRATYLAYFTSLQEKQKRRALELYEKMLEQADKFDFNKFSSNLARDGKLSEAEKIHVRILGSIYKSRIEQLKNSSSVLKQSLGLVRK